VLIQLLRGGITESRIKAAGETGANKDKKKVEQGRAFRTPRREFIELRGKKDDKV